VFPGSDQHLKRFVRSWGRDISAGDPPSGLNGNTSLGPLASKSSSKAGSAPSRQRGAEITEARGKLTGLTWLSRCVLPSPSFFSILVTLHTHLHRLPLICLSIPPSGIHVNLAQYREREKQHRKYEIEAVSDLHTEEVFVSFVLGVSLSTFLRKRRQKRHEPDR
jgi:hypothetical protein